MLIIGHRGITSVAPENSLKALRAGLDANVDMLEFDVRITRDGIPVVIHDSTLFRTHKKATIVKWTTHESLKRATEKGHQIATLEEVLDALFGKIMLNLEIKSRGGGVIAAKTISKYIKKKDDWQNILISSFMGRELRAVRKYTPHANLALLHNRNPFAFIAYHRQIGLSAVGFHRLYTNPLASEIAKHLGLFLYAYTVNNRATAKRMQSMGMDGIVTDHPERINQALKKV